jgi:hypothetical protein
MQNTNTLMDMNIEMPPLEGGGISNEGKNTSTVVTTETPKNNWQKAKKLPHLGNPRSWMFGAQSNLITHSRIPMGRSTFDLILRQCTNAQKGDMIAVFKAKHYAKALYTMEKDSCSLNKAQKAFSNAWQEPQWFVNCINSKCNWLQTQPYQPGFLKPTCPTRTLTKWGCFTDNTPNSLIFSGIPDYLSDLLYVMHHCSLHRLPTCLMVLKLLAPTLITLFTIQIWLLNLVVNDSTHCFSTNIVA